MAPVLWVENRCSREAPITCGVSSCSNLFSDSLWCVRSANFACIEVDPTTGLARSGSSEICAGYVVAGTAFKVVLLAVFVFGLDEIVPGAAEQRVADRAAGQPRGAAIPYVLRTFNLQFALISHYGERKYVAWKCGVRVS